MVLVLSCSTSPATTGSAGGRPGRCDGSSGGPPDDDARQERRPGDEPMHLKRPRQEPDQSGGRCAVGPVQTRLRVLPAQDRVLVTQDQDLEIFGRAGPGEEGQSAGDATEHEVDQAQRHESRSRPTDAAGDHVRPGQRGRRDSGTPRAPFSRHRPTPPSYASTVDPTTASKNTPCPVRPRKRRGPRRWRRAWWSRG
jgi:hypothetical protein